MLFIPLPKLSEKNKELLLYIYSKCERTAMYEDKNVARSLNVFIDNVKDQDWIYKTLIFPLGIQKPHIKNYWTVSRCCGINFNVFNRGDWCLPHRDINPTKINFLLKGKKKNNIFFPDYNITWDYQFPALLDVSKKHSVECLKDLKTPRITLQVFLTEKIQYYAKTMRKL